MDIDDIVIGERKAEQETLRERLDRMDKRIEIAQALALAAIGVLLIIASSKGS